MTPFVTKPMTTPPEGVTSVIDDQLEQGSQTQIHWRATFWQKMSLLAA